MNRHKNYFVIVDLPTGQIIETKCYTLKEVQKEVIFAKQKYPTIQVWGYLSKTKSIWDKTRVA